MSSSGGGGLPGWMGSADANHTTNVDNFHTRQHMSHRRTGGPIKIIAVHKDKDGNYTVDIQPLVKQVDGIGTPQDHGTIYGIPVHASGGKNGQRLIAPVVGDKGWTQAGDRDHSGVLENNGEASNPGSRREHDWADSYYMGGFASLNKPDSSHVQDENGHTFKTKHSHTSSADQDHTFTSTNNHTITAKKHDVNAPTNGMNVKGNLNPTGGSWSLGGGSNLWSSVWSSNGTIQTSDGREKIVDDTAPALGLNFVLALRPVAYRWKVGGQDATIEGNDVVALADKPGTRLHWGLIAQEVKAAIDAAGVDFGGWVLTDLADPESRQALRYDQFIAPLVKAVQELSARIEALTARVGTLETPPSPPAPILAPAIETDPAVEDVPDVGTENLTTAVENDQ